MFLRDENLRLIDLNELKKELHEDRSSPDWSKEINEHDLEQELAEMFLVAANTTAADYYSPDKLAALSSARTLAFSHALAGRSIFNGIKKAICEFLKEGSTFDEIVDAVLDVLANKFPAESLLKSLLRKSSALLSTGV